MSKLKAVKPEIVVQSKPKILIYGKPGVGKTWTALDFPNVYYIDTEGGAARAHYTEKLQKSGGVYFGVDQGSLDYKEVTEQIKALATESHSYKTVVIDSFTKLYNNARAEAAATGGDDFGRDKKEANKPTRQLISWLDRIDMNVILICHEVPQWGIDSKGERTQTGVTFDGFDKLEYELDLSINVVKQGNSRYGVIRKSRLCEFPEAERFDWSYNEFAKRYGQDVVEGTVKALVLITPEQKAEITALVDALKVPQDEFEKLLTKAKATSIDELDSDKAAKIITFYRDKINKLGAK